LVEMVVAHDELRARTLELAARIAGKSPLTVRIAKEAVRAGQRLAIDDGILYERDLFCLCFSSADKEEGVKAFLEKRPAHWQGRGPWATCPRSGARSRPPTAHPTGSTPR